MAGQLDAYRQEIIMFLRTCTIKFEPFAWAMGEEYMQTYGLEDPHEPWNPYYINMAGQYSQGQEIMTVYSIEDEQQVPFTQELLRTHPKTASLYKVNKEAYTTLEEKYPLYRGLIRTIAYPAGDIESIIAAPNLSLLGYDPSLLDINEQESLILALKEFLSMVRTRWWVEEYTYEDMYAYTFWAMLWQVLPNIMLVQRMKNIRTPYAHQFHVWEYLQSHGLKDYRDVLSNKQSMFLYRNMEYIEKNKGKSSNLLILAENLLEEVAVSLTYKEMYQETDSNWDDLRTTPIFRSFDYITDKELKVEDLPTLNRRLVELEVEHHDDDDFLKDKELELGVQPYNKLPTKLLELRKDPIDTRDEQLLINFLIDTFIYRLSIDDLQYEETLIDPSTSTELPLHIIDIFFLYNLCLWRSSCCDPQDPVHLPYEVPVRMALRRSRPQTKDIRSNIYYDECNFPMKTLMDIDQTINDIYWWNASFSSSQDFIETAVNQFDAFKSFRTEVDNTNSYLYHSAIASFLFDVCIHEPVKVTKQKTTYESWLASHPEIQALCDIIDADTEPCEGYNRIAQKCFDLMFPLHKVDGFINSTRVLDKLYNSIRDLFIRLCSYNVLYLEQERDEKKYLYIEPPDFVVPHKTEYLFDHVWDWILEEYLFKSKVIHILNKKYLDINFTVDRLNIQDIWKRNIPVEYQIDGKITWKDKNQIPWNYGYHEIQHKQKVNTQVHTHATHIGLKSITVTGG